MSTTSQNLHPKAIQMILTALRSHMDALWPTQKDSWTEFMQLYQDIANADAITLVGHTARPQRPGSLPWRRRDEMDAHAAMQEAARRYRLELERVDPDGQGGPLGASVNQDARYAVDDMLRAAAADFLKAGAAVGCDTSRW